MIKWESLLGEKMEVFLRQKWSLGYTYTSGQQTLKQFDHYVYLVEPTATTLSKHLCDGWIQSNRHLHHNTLFKKVTPIRQLGKFLSSTESTTYIIPSGIPTRAIKYTPYIYSIEELRLFFKALDDCQPSPYSPYRHIVIPVFFRLLYFCGLRSGEARLLHTPDINIDTGQVTIRESKGRKQRVIVMSDDMRLLLATYNKKMNQLIGPRIPFFPNHTGHFYSSTTIDTWFHEFWDPLHLIALPSQNNRARVHDFRHTYAVHRLNKWVETEENVNALYPYLSESLGHASFYDTDYYLKMSPTFYSEYNRRMDSIKDNLPEVITYEEDN